MLILNDRVGLVLVPVRDFRVFIGFMLRFAIAFTPPRQFTQGRRNVILIGAAGFRTISLDRVARTLGRQRTAEETDECNYKAGAAKQKAENESQKSEPRSRIGLFFHGENERANRLTSNVIVWRLEIERIVSVKA